MISCMLWFIFDFKSVPDIVTQGELTYAVLDVVRPESTSLNSDTLSAELSKTSSFGQSVIQSTSMIGDRLVA